MRLKLSFVGLLCGLTTFVNAQVSELSDLQFFVGTGNDTAGLVIDFLDGSGSFAWGILFNDSIDGQGMLESVAAADPAFSIDVSSGFLNDIFYQSLAGQGGQPNWWGTWSGTPFFWTPNLGLATTVTPGTWFGCSYTDFNPALEPSIFVAAAVLSHHENTAIKIDVYPIPVQDVLKIEAPEPVSIKVVDVRGQIIDKYHTSQKHALNTSQWSSGVYSIVAETNSGDRLVRRVIK